MPATSGRNSKGRERGSFLRNEVSEIVKEKGKARAWFGDENNGAFFTWIRKGTLACWRFILWQMYAVAIFIIISYTILCTTCILSIRSRKTHSPRLITPLNINRSIYRSFPPARCIWKTFCLRQTSGSRRWRLVSAALRAHAPLAPSRRMDRPWR